MSLAREKMAWVKDIDGEFSHVDLWARYAEIVSLKIKAVWQDGDCVWIRFEDDRTLTIADGGQSCCEHRYMTCDDDLSGHEGGQLLSVDMDAAAPPTTKIVEDDDNYGDNCHEQMFVKVQTTKGSFTVCAHNEHNGYYGGFSLAMRLS